MRKDIIIGIIFGISFGLLIAFGFWRVNIAYKSKDIKISDILDKNLQKSKSADDFSISLASPEDSDVVSDNPISLSGITSANAKVIISSEEKDYIINTTANGSFEQKVDLIGGVNQILITAFDEKGGKTEKILTIVYSTEFTK